MTDEHPASQHLLLQVDCFEESLSNVRTAQPGRSSWTSYLLRLAVLLMVLSVKGLKGYLISL